MNLFNRMSIQNINILYRYMYTILYSEHCVFKMNQFNSIIRTKWTSHEFIRWKFAEWHNCKINFVFEINE